MKEPNFEGRVEEESDPIKDSMYLLIDTFYIQYIAFSETFVKRLCADEVIESRNEMYKVRKGILNSMILKLDQDYKDLEVD